MSDIPTPHITALYGDFAKTVLMPGDPLRAKFIAENFLSDTVLVNSVRGINGYTGYYNGKRVSVMASGMGMPSIGIYAYELYNFYGVDNIIRVGSAGAMSDSLNIKDIVLAEGACTNSDFQKQYGLSGYYSPIADFRLLKKADKIATELNLSFAVGNVFSTDTFYNDSCNLECWRKMNVLCTEMETAALYMVAARAGKAALSILTISDCPFKKLSVSAEERQKSFTEMMRLSLETAE